MKNANLILKMYSFILTCTLIYLITVGMKSKHTVEKFKEITVERINIVEPDGKLKMVVSNSSLQHPGMFDGEILFERERPPGIIFFNEEQDEVGGLIYEGNKKDGAGMVLSFDQYKNDQIMQMQYLRGDSGEQQYGMNIWDRTEKFTLPELEFKIDSLEKSGIPYGKKLISILDSINNNKPISAQRLFAGKDFDNNVGLFIKDEFGNSRINIYVDENNTPKFQILDSEGEIMKEFIFKK